MDAESGLCLWNLPNIGTTNRLCMKTGGACTPTADLLKKTRRLKSNLPSDRWVREFLWPIATQPTDGLTCRGLWHWKSTTGLNLRRKPVQRRDLQPPLFSPFPGDQVGEWREHNTRSLAHCWAAIVGNFVIGSVLPLSTLHRRVNPLIPWAYSINLRLMILHLCG